MITNVCTFHWDIQIAHCSWYLEFENEMKSFLRKFSGSGDQPVPNFDPRAMLHHIWLTPKYTHY